MAWSILVRLLSPVFERFSRIFTFLLLWVPGALRAIVSSALSAMNGLKDEGSGTDPEIQGSRPEELETEPEPKTKYGAVGGPRSPDHGRSSSEPPGVEAEEDFDNVEYRVPTTDEFYCEYDSSWETEQPRSKDFFSSWRQSSSSSYMFRRFQSAAKDMHTYRHDYPGSKPSSPSWWSQQVSKPNLKFYLGEKPSSPDGVYVSEFHNKWAGNYDRLERVHSYIQWLFPLPEKGMNHEATPLTKEEIQDFRCNKTATENLLKSYELMLDFYGIKLCNKTTGEVKRAPNWKERFSNLNRNTHNNLRITRILKCLGILGYPKYQAPLVRFFLEETLIHKELPDVRDSVLNYFLFAVRDKKQRRRLIKFAYMNYHFDDEFVWCPKKIQQKWSETKERKMRKKSQEKGCV